MAAIDHSTPDLMAELNEVRGRVREQLGELLDALDHEGGAYTDRYAEWFITSGPGRGQGCGPSTPAALTGWIGKALRDLVIDEATSIRLYGRRRSQRPAVEQSLINADEGRAHHHDVYPRRSRA